MAFLNLHNGSIEPLEAWHWVTIVGMRQTAPDAGTLSIYDGDAAFDVDLAAWLASTRMGGGFVRVAGPQPPATV